MEKFKHFLWFQLPAIAYAIAIFIQSSIPDISTPDLGFDWQDKLFHAIEYAILGYLLMRALIYQRNVYVHERAGYLALLIGSVYAISDEIHQYYVPGRSGDVYDALADFAGILLIVLIYCIGKQLIRRKHQRSFIKIK